MRFILAVKPLDSLGFFRFTLTLRHSSGAVQKYRHDDECWAEQETDGDFEGEKINGADTADDDG